MTESGTVATIDGCAIAYRMDGDEQSPVLLLSNSLGTTWDLWEPQLAAFTSRYRVLRYDSRGHGRSDVPMGNYSLDRLGLDAVELLDGLGIGIVDFCGMSLGGMIGQWLGVRAPQRLRRVVLANTTAFMGPASSWQNRMIEVLKSGMPSIADPVIDRWFTAEFVRAHPEAVGRLRQQLLSTSAIGYAGCCAAIRDMDLRPTARLIKHATLVLGGTRDPATPAEHSRGLAKAIVGARLVMLHAAHLSSIEQPEEFAYAVLRFLSA